MRQVLARWLPAGSFARNVGVLTGGTAFAQGLAVLALPLLTRLYAPEDFALLAVYVAFLGIATVVSCLRYNIAIPLPENDADGMALLAVALVSATAVSAALTLPVLLAPTWTAALLGQPGLQPYLWMVPVGVFLASTYNALQYWTSRKKRFGLVTRTRMTRALGGIGAQAAIGAVVASPFGLIFGHMLYGGLGVVGLTRDLLRRDRHLILNIHMQSVTAKSLEYRDFPTRSLPAALLDAGYQNIPILLLAVVLEEEVLGVLFLTIRAMATPLSMIGSAMSQVYLSSARDKLEAGTLGIFTRRLMLRLLVSGVPTLFVLGIMAWASSGWIFGDGYEATGRFALWMIPWLSMQIITSPVSPIFAVTRNQSAWLMLQISGFLMIVGATSLSAYYLPQTADEVFMIANAVFYTFLAAATLRLTYRIEGKQLCVA